MWNSTEEGNETSYQLSYSQWTPITAATISRTALSRTRQSKTSLDPFPPVNIVNHKGYTEVTSMRDDYDKYDLKRKAAIIVRNVSDPVEDFKVVPCPNISQRERKFPPMLKKEILSSFSMKDIFCSSCVLLCGFSIAALQLLSVCLLLLYLWRGGVCLNVSTALNCCSLVGDGHRFFFCILCAYVCAGIASSELRMSQCFELKGRHQHSNMLMSTF